MRLRPLLLATIFGALALPVFADPAPMELGTGIKGVERPSPIAGGAPVFHAKPAGKIPSWATPRVGDGRAAEARRAAEAAKSEQK
jgi:hypothetical protein